MIKAFTLLLIATLFFGIELYFCKQGVYCFSWVNNGLFYIVTLLSCTLFLALYNHFSKTAIAILITGFIIVVPTNMYYLNELKRLKSESDSIVHFAHKHYLEADKFPTKIPFQVNSKISYYYENDDSFGVSFYVSHPSSGHFYNSKSGWGYMDD